MKTVRILLILLLGVFVTGALAGLYFWKANDIRLYSVQSSLMEPSLQKGDLIVVVKPSTINKGDIISYYDSDGQVITQRVVGVKNNISLTTSNDAQFGEFTVPTTSVIGKTAFSISHLGYVLDQLRNPLVLFLAVYLPALAIVVLEIKRLGGYLGHRSYHIGHRV